MRWTIREVEPAAIAKVQEQQQQSGRRLGSLLSEAIDQWKPESDISAEVAELRAEFSQYCRTIERLVQELLGPVPGVEAQSCSISEDLHPR